MERRLQFEELTLLQTRGSELCHAIVDPSWVRRHLFEGMRLATLHHTEMVRELAALRAVVSSVVRSVFGRSPTDTLRMEVVCEVAVEF
jgi:hypothetical protein